mmetsp:Transcript_35159/g.111784  ORF Transcript_35159/g.111784 Transcript_35159/m.111784 type:complete len:187 (+) Transcript_35159:128-688(+)
MSCFSPGDVVQGYFPDDGEWYLATVEEANVDGTYSVDWFDGDLSHRTRRADELRLMKFDRQLQRYERARQPEEAGRQGLEESGGLRGLGGGPATGPAGRHFSEQGKAEAARWEEEARREELRWARAAVDWESGVRAEGALQAGAEARACAEDADGLASAQSRWEEEARLEDSLWKQAGHRAVVEGS